MDIYNENYRDHLGGGNRVHKSVILPDNLQMGKNNVFEPGVIIGKNVQIGDNNYFGAYTIVGDIPESKDYFENHTGQVVIGNNNRFTKKVTIDGGTNDKTVIFDNVVMLVNSHVGHDAFIWHNVSIRCNAVVGGWCRIEKDTQLGVGSFVHQRITVPENCFIGAGSVVTKQTNMKPGYIYVGVPAKELKKNVRNTVG